MPAWVFADDSAADTSAPAVEVLTREQVEAARRQTAPSAEVYQDRFMQAEDLKAAELEEEAALREEPEGLRSWSVETRVGAATGGATGAPDRRAHEAGLRLDYRQQTLNFGEWLLQADGRVAGGDASVGWGGLGALGMAGNTTGARVTLRNLGLPLAGGWWADTTVGDAYSEITDGLARSQRLSLGTTTVRGLGVRLYRGGTELRAGWGVRGALAGGPFAGFEQTQGQLAWAGATRLLDKRWYVAGQAALAKNIPERYYNLFEPTGSGSVDVGSWALAVGQGLRDRWDEGGLRWRATWMGSRVSAGVLAPSATAHGLFLEGRRRVGRATHEFGLHWAQPRLYQGDYPLLVGQRGLYWRMDHASQRLSWNLGVDHERGGADGTWSLAAYRRTGLSGGFQYQASRRTSYGGNLSLANVRYQGSGTTLAGSRGRSATVYGFYQTRIADWPRSRFSLTWRRNEQIVLDSATATGYELQWEQDWLRELRETRQPEFTTTLGHAWDRSGGGPTRRYPTAGVRGRLWFDNDLMLAAQLRYTAQHGGLSSSRGLSGNLSAERSLGNGWHFGLQASFNEARVTVPMGGGWAGPARYQARDRSVQLFLRWDGQRGRPHQVLGDPRGQGTGRIEGRVFFDHDGDGRQQPGEAGAPQVEVLLDGRYRTRTDRDGRFEFPVVSTGRHQITVVLDTVPLPWTAAAEAGTSAHVPLRGQALVDIPLMRGTP